MSIVLQYDSRQNVTYAYHNDVTWDSQSKRTYQKRTLIGRIDANTSLIIPTSGKRRKNVVDEELIKKEIEAYNNKVTLQKQNSSSPDGLENLGDIDQKFQELSQRCDEIKDVLISFSDTIRSIYNLR